MIMHACAYGRTYMDCANFFELCVTIFLVSGFAVLLAINLPHEALEAHSENEHSAFYRILRGLHLRGFVVMTRGYITYRKLIKINNLNIDARNRISKNTSFNVNEPDLRTMQELVIEKLISVRARINKKDVAN